MVAVLEGRLVRVVLAVGVFVRVVVAPTDVSVAEGLAVRVATIVGVLVRVAVAGTEVFVRVAVGWAGMFVAVAPAEPTNCHRAGTAGGIQSACDVWACRHL